MMDVHVMEGEVVGAHVTCNKCVVVSIEINDCI